jgi:hypothetical protein
MVETGPVCSFLWITGGYPRTGPDGGYASGVRSHRLYPPYQPVGSPDVPGPYPGRRKSTTAVYSGPVWVLN